MSDLKNLIITVLLSITILLGWQYFYEIPRAKKYDNKPAVTKQINNNNDTVKPLISREDSINLNKRVEIRSDKLSGSINLQGLRFDDLSLNKYKESIGSENGKVILLSPSSTKESYFVEVGWISKSDEDMPNSNSIWSADKEVILPNQEVTFTWSNNSGLDFTVKVILDENYLFKIEQSVSNNADKEIELAPYGLVSKLLFEKNKSYSILHEGPIGVFGGKLVEHSYEDLKPGQKENFAVNNNGDWLGITDKYWLTALFPAKEINFNGDFLHINKSGKDIYQADYLGHMNLVKPETEIRYTHYLFTGAKELKLLDIYKDKYHIKLFDRAVDFGWFYFLTKPMFYAIKYLYMLFGNFGVAILVLTIIIKAIMFPLANRSYKSMNKMKSLQPELTRLKDLYGDDKLKLNKEMIELYKKYNINPLAGCLPLIVQIPVFFSLYKVLFVTIEMRHAPFFGWIKDLSAADPTTIFNLFGLIPWNPPGFLMVGIWPILMGVTMYLQQKMNPEPTDPVQAQVMKFLPLIFVFMFNSFPAGLVIYWAWNNILTMIQQFVISKTESEQIIKR